jgi:hypothetical protein
MLQAGDCYLLTTNTDSRGYEVQHLHVVLLDGEQYTNNTIVVPICTYDSPKQDQTTLLEPGEHEFIVRPSYVNYRRAKTASIPDIQRLIDAKTAKQKPQVGNNILTRICEGIMKSPHTPFEVKAAYERCMFRKIQKK